MIFVTVGNATQGFRRLLDGVDRLVRGGAFGAERVLVQSGNTPGFVSQGCEVVPFLEASVFLAAMEAASLIVSHAGAGTVIHALRLGKVPVVMPRRRRDGEAVDDHQVELARALASEGRIVLACEAQALGTAVAEARRRGEGRRADREPRMLSCVAAAIDELSRTGAKKT